MGKIVNKRNALLGWFTWRIGKRVARKKARSAVPAVEGGRPNKPAIATGIAALGGALLFWRRKRRRASAGGDVTGPS
jgi:LPXTG-motif cell wall-anchored protein